MASNIVRSNVADLLSWGYVKSIDNADETLDVLEENIRRDIADVRPNC